MRFAVILLLCLVVSACGVKPKHLEHDGNFPATYPQE